MGTDDGATDYLPQLLAATLVDMLRGYRPAPWLTLSTSDANNPLNWQCLDRNYTLTNNESLSFCPGSNIRGEIKPYFVTREQFARTISLSPSLTTTSSREPSSRAPVELT